jgi:hypothetical protein
MALGVLQAAAQRQHVVTWIFPALSFIFIWMKSFPLIFSNYHFNEILKEDSADLLCSKGYSAGVSLARGKLPCKEHQNKGTERTLTSCFSFLFGICRRFPLCLVCKIFSRPTESLLICDFSHSFVFSQSIKHTHSFYFGMSEAFFEYWLRAFSFSWLICESILSQPPNVSLDKHFHLLERTLYLLSFLRTETTH